MPIRVGVIGTGVMAQSTSGTSPPPSAGPAPPSWEISAAAAPQQLHPPPARITTDSSELINSSEVDAVVIASDGSTHAGLVLECFGAMTPMLCEKPFAPRLLESSKSLKLKPISWRQQVTA